MLLLFLERLNEGQSFLVIDIARFLNAGQHIVGEYSLSQIGEVL